MPVAVDEPVEVPLDVDAAVEAPLASNASDEIVIERPGFLERTGLVERLATVNGKRALALAVVLVLLALTLSMPVRTYLSQRGEYNRLQAQNAQLADEVERYERKITQQNDPAYIEAQARERLQYVMPGEKPMVMSFPERDRQQAEERKAAQFAANPWYSNLWDAVSTPPEDK